MQCFANEKRMKSNKKYQCQPTINEAYPGAREPPPVQVPVQVRVQVPVQSKITSRSVKTMKSEQFRPLLFCSSFLNLLLSSSEQQYV